MFYPDVILLAKHTIPSQFPRKTKMSNHQTLRGSIKWPRQYNTLFVFLPMSPLNSPHSNNCPPQSRKTPVPLENSITRFHKRFKIMVFSLCGERECTRPQQRQGVDAQSHRPKWEILYYHILKQLQRFYPQSLSKGLTGRLQTFRVKLCISGQPVGPWELPSMLNQTVITNKSRSAWPLEGTLELHHAGLLIWHSF